MPDYRAMYFRLFNHVTDAIRLLQQAQLEGEDSYISGEDKIPGELLNFQECDDQESPSD